MSLSKSTADGEYKRHIFLNGIGYYTFDSVVAAVQPGETIEIDGEVVMGTSRSELGNVTIKGISEDAVLKRNKEFQKLMWKLTGDLNLENITIDGNTENGNDGVLIELNAGNNTFTNVKFCNVTKVGSNECLVQVKQGCRSLALNNVAVENCDAASARGAIQIDGNCGANVTASGLDDLSFLVGGTRFVTLSDLDNAAKIVLYADANRQDGSVIVKGTSDVAAVEHANFYLEADSKNNQLVYYATEPFAFNEVIGDALVVNHIYKTYAPNSSKHEAGEYSIQLPRDATFFNLPVEGLTATLAADESVWTVNNWDGVVPEGEVAEAYHAANHWRYHKAEVKEVSASKVDFEAAQAGRYVLTLSLPETYNGSVKGERSKTYAIEVVPAVKVADFSDHKAPEGVSNKDLLFSEEALNNVKIYVVDGNNNETIVAVHEKTAGWALTANEGIDLTNCRVATKYGSRNILYQVTETPAAAEEDIEDEYLAPAFRSVNTEGYADAADGIDLSNAKSLSLIQKVNGVYSDPINITFAEEPIETGVKSIEAAEEAAEAEYFTLEGIRAELPLAPGAYVCRRGQKANVIMVK